MESTATAAHVEGRDRDVVHGVAMIAGGVGALQFGAALAATLFPMVGPIAVVMLRLTTAAVVLTLVQRPRLRGRTRRELVVPVVLGLVMAVMNTCLYEAIDRLPLGVAITLEFLGPIAVALVSSRRLLDALLAVAAGAGVVLLTGGVHDVNLAGVLFALTAAGCWSGYIVLNRSIGRTRIEGSLSIAAIVAAAVMVPIAIANVGLDVFQPKVLVLGVLVGLLCSVVPYTTDMLALRRLPVGTFSVLMSIHPATAALAGFVVLDESLSVAQLLGIALVIVASAVASVTSARHAVEC